MTCEECEEILLDSDNCASRTGWMPGVSVLNLARLHAENCPACATRVLEMSRMNDALGQLRISTKQMQAPATIEANLLLEFRKRTSRTVSGSRAFRWRLVWGSGIVFALIAGIVSYSGLKPVVNSESHRIESPSLQKPSPPDSSASLNPDFTERRHVDAAHPHVPSSKRVPRKVEESPRESRLPAQDELSLNGGSNVVRVTLPLASLVAMGAPMYPGGPDRRVTADVARDPFGAVIAIHLVETRPSTN